MITYSLERLTRFEGLKLEQEDTYSRPCHACVKNISPACLIDKDHIVGSEKPAVVSKRFALGLVSGEYV